MILPSSKLQVPSSASGFTAIEVVVMFTIIAMISFVVLTSFTGINEGAALHRSAQELAYGFRRAQNFALSVRGVRPGDPPGSIIVPDAVGIRVVQGEGGYIIFADYDFANNNPIPRNNIYDGFQQGRIQEIIGKPREQTGFSEEFFRNVKIQALSPQSPLHILFEAPEATMQIYDGAGNLLNNVPKATIVLQAPSGQTATVEVHTSGQISIK